MIFIIMRALGEMAAHDPVAGSFSTYAHKYLGPFAGYLTGWNYWILMMGVGMAESTAVGIYMKQWFPELPQWLWVFGSVVLIGGLNLMAVKVYGELEFWFTTDQGADRGADDPRWRHHHLARLGQRRPSGGSVQPVDTWRLVPERRDRHGAGASRCWCSPSAASRRSAWPPAEASQPGAHDSARGQLSDLAHPDFLRGCAVRDHGDLPVERTGHAGQPLRHHVRQAGHFRKRRG